MNLFKESIKSAWIYIFLYTQANSPQKRTEGGGGGEGRLAQGSESKTLTCLV